jgi:CBS domain-containing protein
VTVSPDITVEELIRDVVLPTRHSAFPVVDDGRAAGLVSFRDALAVPRAAWARTRVGDIMVSAEAACVDPSTPLAETLARLAGGKLQRLLVCRDGRLCGLLSVTDVIRVLEARSRLEEPAQKRAAGSSSSSASRVRTSATA